MRRARIGQGEGFEGGGKINTADTFAINIEPNVKPPNRVHILGKRSKIVAFGWQSIVTPNPQGQQGPSSHQRSILVLFEQSRGSLDLAQVRPTVF